MRVSQLPIFLSWVTNSLGVCDFSIRLTSFQSGLDCITDYNYNPTLFICHLLYLEMTLTQLWNQFRISNSCYMAAAIQFNYAMFHIFSGPLFANLQGYVFLDLLIWGVSPILFQLCRVRLRQHIQPIQNANTQKYHNMIVKRRLLWLFGCFLAIVVSFLFMNYSQNFCWNYFSRIVNLDFGYLLFDLACRLMELVVQIQEEEQQRALLVEQRDTLQPIYHKGGYCKYRNIFMMASYFLVFYLSNVFDPDDIGSGRQIFNSLSVLSCLVTVAIPLLYLFRHRPGTYSLINSSQNCQDIIQAEPEYIGLSEWTNRTYVTFILISFSFFVNTSYFSMWVMQGLKQSDDHPYQQFNKTLFISSAFFLVSSFIQFVVTHTYIGCKISQGLVEQGSKLQLSIKPFLCLYGLLMVCMFAATKTMQWHYMVIPIIPFGFHYILVNFLTEKVADLKGEDKNRPGHHKIYFYCQSCAYLVIPAVLTLMGQIDSALMVFGYLSGGSLIVAGLLY